MSIARHGLKLELHRHGAPHAADLTPYAIRVTDIHGRMAPYGGLDVDLDVPAAEWARLPAPGDWLVLRDARTLRTLQLGAVASPDTGVDAAGPRVETRVTQVSAHTWLDYLGRVLVYTHDRETVGTFMSVGDFNELLKSGTSLARDGLIGATLADVMQRLPNVMLPGSLGDRTLGSAIRVAYSIATAGPYAGDRIVESVRGYTVRGPESVNAAWRGGVSVLDLLRSTFDHGTDLIEFFPSIEPLPSTEGLGARDFGLGANLTLVYRVPPWRVRALDVQFPGGSPANRGLDPGIIPNFWGGVTWHPETARVVAADEIASVSHSQPDDNRINAVSADIMGAGEEWFTLVSEAGLPIIDAVDVKNYGLRLYNPRWPFFRATGMSATSVVRTVAAQAAQFMFGAERFMSGSATLNHLRRDIRQGEIVRFDLHRTKVLTAYVDRVQHVVTASAAIEGTTTVFFSRGLFDERLRDVQVSIDLPVVAPEQGTSQQSSPGSAIVFNGQLLPIAWANVRLFDRADGLALTAGFTTSRRSMAAIDMGVLHWDATLKARKTRKVLADRGLSTHFVIDWDGTIYQLVDLAYPAWHAGTTAVNNRSVGVDLNTPVRTGASTEVALAQLNARLFLGGQPVRPIVTGWKVNAQEIAPFLGFHDVQLDAFRALAAALKTHFGVPLVSPAYAGSQTLVTVPSLNGLAPGWYHHAEVSSEALHGADGTPLPIKEDTCGVELPDVLAQAGPFPATPSPSP